MFELVDLVLAFVCGIVTTVAFMSWLVNRWARRIRQLLEEAMNETDQPGEEQTLKDQVNDGKIILLEVEVDNNQFFCYNSKTNQFVCQGSNASEIIENFKQRFPGLNAILHTGDETALKTLRQQLKEHRENSNSVGSTS
jgi:hypothetical protein